MKIKQVKKTKFETLVKSTQLLFIYLFIYSYTFFSFSYFILLKFECSNNF